jgi:pantoate--beta-alanine ligase
MVTDLLLPLEIVGVPTVREADGLAMSSRNRFLSERERAVAPDLYASLCATVRAMNDGGPVADALAAARAGLAPAGFAVDYLALVDGARLAPIDALQPDSRLIAAARLGSVRLLDNIDAGGGRTRTG